MQNFFKSVLGNPCKIEIELDESDKRQWLEISIQVILKKLKKKKK